MVKSQNNCNRKGAENQAILRRSENANKIGPDTAYGLCNQKLSAFGGILGLEKLLALIKYENVFTENFVSPERRTELGCLNMIKGIIYLLFIGFQRIGHFEYIRKDKMMTGSFNVEILPAVSTYWRYMKTLGINQAKSLLKISSIIRTRVWQLCGIKIKKVTILIDTTVSTVYGNIEGGRKGYNPKHRGKKGLRPILSFIGQTREYLCGKQRKGTTTKVDETAALIKIFDSMLPGCVEEVEVLADGEFTGWQSIKECEDKNYSYIFGLKAQSPPFKDYAWYRHDRYEYNECQYMPVGWGKPCRFVSMRIKEEDKNDRQLKLIDSYCYRSFVTNLKIKPHSVVKKYDKRADVENMIAESHREGISAIPTKRFMANYAFFQIVMFTYNLWRWFKMIAATSKSGVEDSSEEDPKPGLSNIDSNTSRIARLKLLYIAAKITYHSNRHHVYYSVHDHRARDIVEIMVYLDKRRSQDITYSDVTRLTSRKTAG